MFKYIKFFILLLFLCNTIYISNANAATINATSCSQTDVQSAINSASDGDTVNIPSGSCTWTTPVNIVDKDITIVGAGQGTTNITYNGPDAYNSAAFHVDNDAGTPKDDFEISHLTIIHGSSLGNIASGTNMIMVWDAGPDWRIHHVTITSAYSGSMVGIGRNQGSNSGLVDNCIFNATNSSGHTKAFQINAKDRDTETAGGSPSVSNGSTSWGAASTFGTKENLYIEDCTFNWTAVYTGADMDEGARVVWRYNTFTGTGIGSHGDDGGNTDRGVRHYEIYNNTFDSNGVGHYVCIGLRGGTGVIYNNTFSGNYGTGLIMYHYCADACTGPCSGGWTKPCSYPCSGQIGQGPDNTTDPLYFWNNTWNDGLGLTVQSCASSIIQSGRDYYNESGAKPGYTAYTYPHPLRNTTQGSPAPPYVHPLQ
jgi:hypothetical protein